jgi:hypothetical protein
MPPELVMLKLSPGLPPGSLGVIRVAVFGGAFWPVRK